MTIICRMPKLISDGTLFAYRTRNVTKRLCTAGHKFVAALVPLVQLPVLHRLCPKSQQTRTSCWSYLQKCYTKRVYPVAYRLSSKAPCIILTRIALGGTYTTAALLRTNLYAIGRSQMILPCLRDHNRPSKPSDLPSATVVLVLSAGINSTLVQVV